jgi:hypothetical protein
MESLLLVACCGWLVAAPAFGQYGVYGVYPYYYGTGTYYGWDPYFDGYYYDGFYPGEWYYRPYPITSPYVGFVDPADIGYYGLMRRVPRFP